MTPILRPTIAEVDLTKLMRNLQKVRSQVGPQTQLLAILKANAYGHGAETLGQFIEEKQLAQWFGVACVEEGIALREAGLKTPILVLGSIYPFEAFEYAIKYDLAVTIASLQAAHFLFRLNMHVLDQLLDNQDHLQLSMHQQFLHF